MKGVVIAFIISIVITLIFTKTEDYKPKISSDDNMVVLTLLSCSLIITSILIAFVITNLYTRYTKRVEEIINIKNKIEMIKWKYPEISSNLIEYTRKLKEHSQRNEAESDETFKLKLEINKLSSDVLGYDRFFSMNIGNEFIYVIYIIMLITIVGFWFVRIQNKILHFIINLIVISIFVFSIYIIYKLQHIKVTLT